MVNYRVMVIVLIFILFDVISGLLKAFKEKNLNSTKMREGLLSKLAEVVAVLLGMASNVVLPMLGIDMGVDFAILIGTYIVLMEICSVIENIGAINEPLGAILGKVFEKLKQPEE